MFGFALAGLTLAEMLAAPPAPVRAADAGKHGAQCFNEVSGYRVVTGEAGKLYMFVGGRDLYEAQFEGACPNVPPNAGLTYGELLSRSGGWFCAGEIGYLYFPSAGAKSDRCAFKIVRKLTRGETAALTRRRH